MATKEKALKKSKLRHAEYYDFQEIQDKLYAESIPHLPLLSDTAFLLMLHRVQSLHIQDFLRSDIPICA